VPVVMEYLGCARCVVIMSGIVPDFSTGRRPWGEFMSEGSPKQDFQRLALHLPGCSIS
jgi:hypothetical protein